MKPSSTNNDRRAPVAKGKAQPLDRRSLFCVAALAAAIQAAHAVPASGPFPVSAMPMAPPAEAERAERIVVFIDGGVADSDILLRKLPLGADVFHLDANSDGLSQIASALQNRVNVPAIHILSHGASGQIQLGNTRLDQAGLAQHAAQLDIIGKSLAPEGDILLYGCEVAQDERGQAFVQALATATSADVAASDDWSGAPHKGGNWQLETSVGPVDSVALVLDESYPHLLATLSAGDLVVLGINALPGNQSVHFATLVDIPAGTVIKVTDRGWDQSIAAFTDPGSGDGVMTWTTSSPISAGTLFQLVLGASDNTPPTALRNVTAGNIDLTADISIDGYSVTSAFNIGGEQIFLYQDTDSNPFFLFGLNASRNTNLDGTFWQTSITAALVESMIPNGLGSQNALTNGVDAVGILTNPGGGAAAQEQFDNVAYIGPTASTDRAGWLARVTNAANWSGDDTGVLAPSVGISSGSGLSVGAPLTAPSLNATAGNPTFTENGSAVDLFSAVTAATNDSGQTFSSLLFTVSNLSDGAHEIISVGGSDVVLSAGNSGSLSGIGNFAVSLSAGTATVTLSSMALGDAQMSSLIDGMGYRNTSDAPGTKARLVTLTTLVDSGSSANSASPGISSTVSIVPVNDAPQATKLSHTVSVTEDTVGVTLDDIVVTDPDADDTITATLSLSKAGAGSLSTGTYGAATSTFNAGTGVWTVTGAVADVNAALAAVTFTPAANWDQDLNLTTRIRDAAGTGPADGNITLDLIPVNDAPTAVTLSAYSVGQSAASKGATVASLSASDVDSSSFTFALVSTGAGGAGTCFSDADNDKFQIDGAQLKAAEALSLGSHVLCIQVNDGEASYKTSLPFSVTDDLPPTVLSVSVPAAGHYAAGAALSFRVTTSEPVTLSGGPPSLSLTIGSTTRTAGLTGHSGTGFDFLYTVQAGDLDDNGISVDALDLNGATMADSAHNVLVTTLAGVADSSGVRVDTSAPAVTASTPAAAAAQASSVVFTVTFDEAVTGISTSAFTLTRTAGVSGSISNVTAGSTSAEVTVSGISGVGTLRLDTNGTGIVDQAGNPAPAFSGGSTHTVNTAPALVIDDSALGYAEGSAALAIDAAATLSDPNGDSDWWNGGTLSVQITANGESTDEISLLDDDADAILITVSGTDLLANGSKIGTLSSADGIVTGDTLLNISFTGTTASNASVQEVLQSLRFRSSSANPGTAPRVITVTATDRNGHSASDSRSVTISTSNDAPGVSGLPARLGFMEDTAGNFDLSTLSVSDADSSIATLKLVASAGSFSAVSAGGVTVSGSGSGTLTLTGAINDLNSYLGDASRIQYSGAANAEGGNAASVSVSIADGDGSAEIAAGTIAVDISGVDDPAVITGSFSGNVTEGNPGDTASTSGSIAISDVDASDNPVFHDVPATPGDQGYGTFTLSAGTWTYLLDQNAVQHLNAGQTVTDNITFSASDGSSQLVTVTITGSADGPVISDLDGTLDYLRGAGPQALDLGTPISISDLDSSDFNGGSLRVSISAGGDPEEDLLSFAPMLNIGVDGSAAGSDVSVEGIVVGTLGEDLGLGKDLVVNFNANATPARVASLLQALSYQNIDTQSPTLGARTLDIVLNGDGASVQYSVLINVRLPAAPPGSGGSVIDTYTANTGVINNAVISPRGTVEGGTLGGTVRNEGHIRDVDLTPGTRVEGGSLSGAISGNPVQPARILGARVASGAQLSNVIIDQNTVLEPGIQIGANVRFESSANIPAGLDLSGALRRLDWIDADGRGVLALDGDVISPVDGSAPMTLIRSIQLLGEYEPAGNAVEQDSNGEVLIVTADSSSAVLPVNVSQARPGEPEGTYLNEDGDIVFVTVSRRVVLAYPALQDKDGLRAALASFGLALGFDARANLVAALPGSQAASVLREDGTRGQAQALSTTASFYYAGRPEVSALPAPAGAQPGVHYGSVPGLPRATAVSLVFRTAEGELMAQDIVPVPADWPMMKESLQGLGFSEVRIDIQGIVSVRHGNGTLLRGRSGFRVSRDAAQLAQPGRVVFRAAGDPHEDGTEDFQMVFPNGDTQMLYILPEQP